MRGIELSMAAAARPASCSVGDGSHVVEYAHCFNLIVDSAQLALFSGVLTGLTFAGIAMVATRAGVPDAESGEEDQYSASLVVLLSALFSFTLATYLLTMASSEVRAEGRAGALAFCASLVLSLAITQLFVGVAKLVEHLSSREEVARFARGVALATIVLVGIYMSMTAIDGSGIGDPEKVAWTSPLAYICLGMLAVLLVWVGVIVARRRRPVRRYPLVSAAAVASVMAYGVVAAVVAEQPYWWGLPPAAYAVLTATLLLFISAYAAIAGAPTPRQDSRDGRTVESPDGSGEARSEVADATDHCAPATGRDHRLDVEELRTRFAAHARDSYNVLYNVMKSVSVALMALALQRLATQAGEMAPGIPLLVASGLAVTLTYAGTTIGMNLLPGRFGVMDAALPLALTVAEAWPIAALAGDASREFTVHAWLAGMVAFNWLAAGTLRLARHRIDEESFGDTAWTEVVRPYVISLKVDTWWAFATGTWLAIVVILTLTAHIGIWLEAGLAAGFAIPSYTVALVAQDGYARGLRRRLLAASSHAGGLLPVDGVTPGATDGAGGRATS